MAWLAPTAEEFVARYLAFGDAPPDALALALAEAALAVDDSWPSESVFRDGQMLYAAHVLTLAGYGGTTEAALAAAGASGIKSIRSGSLSIDRFDHSGLASTSYGRLFAELRRRTFPAILVV